MSAKPLTREEILGADDIEIEEVEVPEWGGVVYVKGMTGTERDRFESSIVDNRGKTPKANMDNIRAKLVAETLCNEEGIKLFSVKDVKALGKKSASALQRVFDPAQRLSGITEADIEELAEEMETNPSNGSVSD
jgi:hypothetical protein